MNAAPLVSVIIPTHNRLPLLRLAVDSVRSQTFEGWELIVVDDGSTDGTGAWVESIGEPRITIIAAGRCGNAALLRNIGVRASRGSYICFLDSDDVWRATKLERQLEAMRAQRGNRWSYTGFEHIDDAGRSIAGFVPPGPHGGWILEFLLDGRARAHTSTLMIERGLFEELGGFDESLVRCQDYDLCLRMAGVSPATFVADRVAGFRQHPGNQRIGWLDVLGFMNRIYAGTLRRTSSRRLRRLARRMQRRVALEIVRKSRAAGLRGDTVAALAACFSYGWWHAGWWVEAGKTALHPVLPARVLTSYHRWKDRAA